MYIFKLLFLKDSNLNPAGILLSELSLSSGLD